jgi:hypothetical protein
MPAGALVSDAYWRPLPGALVSYACQRLLLGAFVSLVLILKTTHDTKKLGFLPLGVLNVGIMNFGCFGFGCVGAGQIGFFEFHYWLFWSASIFSHYVINIYFKKQNLKLGAH